MYITCTGVCASCISLKKAIGMLLCRLRSRDSKVPSMASPRPFGDRKNQKKGYIVLVSGKMAPGQVQNKFIPVFEPLAAHVAEHEEGCFAYELSVSPEDADRFIIYERYVDKQYVEQVHWQSAAFKTFQKGCEAAGLEWLERSVTMYEEQDIGF